MKKIKNYAAFIVCMLGFVLFFLNAFISPAKAEETYTVTVKYEPQQDDNGKVFPFISIIDKTTGQSLRDWITAETLEVEVERGHEIEVRFMMAPGNQFYGIVRSDGWNGGMFTQGTASFDEAKGSQKFGFAGRGDSITDEDAINGWMTTQNSPAGYYYYYLGINNDNTIYLLSYDNIQWYGMTGDERLMNGGYVSKTTSTDDKVVLTADYNPGPMILDWSPKYIHEGIAHDEFKVGDLFGISRTWGTRKDSIALYGGISDKKVITYASDTTTAKSSVYEYPEDTMDAEWSLTDEGITRVDLVNTSPRGAVTTGQVICKVYDNTVTITDYFTADSYPEGAVYDETGYYKLVSTDYGGDYHSTYTADTTGVYDGYVIDSNNNNKISITVCEGENYYKSDKNQVVRYWRPETQNFTLYFDYNKPENALGNITGNDITSKAVTYDSAVGELPVPELTGWTFKGWYDDKGNEYTKETVYRVTGNTTVYASWESNIYTLYFDYNKPGNASGEIIGDDIISKAVAYDSEVGELPVPELTGWTFKGWYDDKGNEYTEETVYRVTGNTTVYASWESNTYTLFFDYNKPDSVSGNITGNDITSKAVTYDSAVGELPVPELTGWTFKGWYDDKGNEYTEETVYRVTGNTTVYASWESNTYTLFFDYNKPDSASGNITGNDITSKAVTYDSAVGELPAPELTGWTFKGWYDDKGNEYTEETVYRVTGNTTVYASWESNTYTLFFDYNKPDSASGNITGNDITSKAVTYDSAVGELPVPELTGWTFKGWYDDKGNEYTEETVYRVTGNTTVYASWESNTYTLYFDYNKPDSASGNITGNDITSKAVTYDSAVGELPVPELTGWTFKGWYDDKGNEYTEETVYRVTSDTTVYASWEANTYTLYFDYNKPGNASGEITGADITSKAVTYDSEIGELPVPELTGWTFKGWYDDKGNEYTEETVYRVTSDTTVYASWEANTYTLYFDYNKPGNASGEITGDDIISKAVTYDSEVGELPVPELTGWTFIGWYTESGEQYTSETIYKAVGDTTLYAYWDEAPEIKAIDRYFTLKSAQNGKITLENLLSTASASDDIDSPEDIKLEILDYAARDFEILTGKAQITIMYRATDSVGNKTMKMITVHIVDTTAKVIKPNTYARSISEKYYDKSYEDGGLEPDSIWRTNSYYAEVLKSAMENRASIKYETKYFKVLWMNIPYIDYSSMTCNHIEEIWEFTSEDIKKVKEFINEHGFGKTKDPDGLKKFYETFSYCRKV